MTQRTSSHDSHTTITRRGHSGLISYAGGDKWEDAMEQCQGNRPVFALDVDSSKPGWGKVLSRLRWPVEKLLCFDQLNHVYNCASASSQDAAAFCQEALRELGVAPAVSVADLERIPKTGPVVVVANHPYGAIDGIMLGQVLRSVRPDVKIMASYHLGRMPALRDLFILVDNFAGKGATSFNRSALKQTLDWLRDGHMLAVFPAGEVAHYDLNQRRIVEGAWSDTIARIIRRTNASVLPIYFDGSNSAFFHLAGLVHPRLRTVLLPREVFNKGGRRVEMRVGRLIPHRTVRAIGEDAEMMAYLKLRTQMLASRTEDGRKATPSNVAMFGSPGDPQPIVPAAAAELLSREVAELPADLLLNQTDDLAVYAARAQQIPRVLREIGRLRETTFRAVGEGTGKSIDLDEFDAYYLHLFVWNKSKNEVVAAYRIGKTDEIQRMLGIRGLYTSTLFKYKPRLLEEMGPALELGRSFVRAEYQKSYAPLLMLWKGIGHWVVRHPRYKILFGPVSITNDYHEISRQLMVSYLSEHESMPSLAKWVKPRTPFRSAAIDAWDQDVGRLVKDIEGIADFVADLEIDEKGVPILLRQYLKLGGKLLGFNVDPSFSNCVDGLIVVDLTKADRRALSRYMSRDGLASFLKFHNVEQPELQDQSI